ncbi:MAG: PilZ domain-containing protein [Deltaproteobacteria bacterium]|nr:PilZ domain-containing protein [Deltaproteobacteria bacterium]
MLHLERRRFPRYRAMVNVALYIFDAIGKKPLTGKVPGCLTDISRKGGCLQTNYTRLENYHILLDADRNGKTVLCLDLPPASDGTPVSLKANVVSYNRIDARRQFQFDIRLQFPTLSSNEWQHLEGLINSARA